MFTQPSMQVGFVGKVWKFGKRFYEDLKHPTGVNRRKRLWNIFDFVFFSFLLNRPKRAMADTQHVMHSS